MVDPSGRSVPDGLGGAEAPEPHSGLGPSDAIPSAESIRAAIVGRYTALVKERAKLADQMAATEPGLRACRAAARVFGFDLPPAPRMMNSTTLQAIIDKLLKASGQRGVTVAEMRPDAVAAYGAEIHQKSIGVALYRMAKNGMAKRVGRRWFAASAIEARRAETTKIGSAGDESAAPKADAQP